MATPGGQQRRPGVVRADAAQEFIPGTTAGVAAGHSQDRTVGHNAGFRRPASEGSSYHCTCADTGALTTTGCILNGAICIRKLMAAGQSHS